jgi:hypothetical protein
MILYYWPEAIGIFNGFMKPFAEDIKKMDKMQHSAGGNILFFS